MLSVFDSFARIAVHCRPCAADWRRALDSPDFEDFPVFCMVQSSKFYNSTFVCNFELPCPSILTAKCCVISDHRLFFCNDLR